MIRHGVEAGLEADDAEQIRRIVEIAEMPESVEKHEKMVLENPDDYKSWNALKAHILEIEEREKSEIVKEHSKQLMLTQMAIAANPKSYSVWHHRRWLIQRYGMDAAKEETLCRLLFRLDPRNFHCWNHCLRLGLKMPLDFDNYSSIRFSTEKAISAFHCDPSDEGIWRYFVRAREAQTRTDLWLKVTPESLRLCFKRPFCGHVDIGGYKVEILRHALFHVIDSAKSDESHHSVLSFFDAPEIPCELYERGKDKRRYVMVREPPCYDIESVSSLGTESVFVVLEHLRVTEEISGRRRLIEKLCRLDPMRDRYYRSLLHAYTRIFVPCGH